MAIDQSLVGKSSPPQTFEVGREEVLRFMEATQDPVLHSDTPVEFAPPTFPTTFRMRVPGLALDATQAQLLHGEQEYHYTRRLRIGERVTCVARILEVRERSGRSGQMTFLVTETSGSDSERQPVFTARSTSIVRFK